MSIRAQQARQLGAAAFARGAKRVPALDGHLAEFLRTLPRRPDGFSDETIPVLGAWIDGWDQANLAPAERRA
jgi:hypothetical protein